MKKIIVLLLSLLTVITLSACTREESEENTIYVTNYPLYFLVDAIGDGLVTVKYVPGSTVHGHGFEWSGQQIIDMRNADYLFYVGAGLDPYIDANLETLTSTGLDTLKVFDFIDPIEVCIIDDHDHDDHDDEYDHQNPSQIFSEHDDDHDNSCNDAELIEDPHFWLDVVRMMEVAEIIKERLILTYPEHDLLIKNNFLVLHKQLEKLHADYLDALTEVTKPIITNVKLFTYYQERYGIEINPLTRSAHAHEDETIPGDIIDFVNFAIEHDINYIMFEANALSRAGDNLLAELQKENPDASRLDLHPVATITTEELNQGKNYINLMYYNLDALIKATQ